MENELLCLGLAVVLGEIVDPSMEDGPEDEEEDVEGEDEDEYEEEDEDEDEED